MVYRMLYIFASIGCVIADEHTEHSAVAEWDAASEVSKAVCTAAKGSRFKNLSEAECATAHQRVE